MSEPPADADERARRAEAALAAAVEERNRLWAELQEKNATEAEAEYWRGRAAGSQRHGPRASRPGHSQTA